MRTERAADLPVGSIIANDHTAWIKTSKKDPDLGSWSGTGDEMGTYDWEPQDALDAGAIVLRRRVACDGRASAADEPGRMILDEWRSLRGTDLEQAMLAVRWYVQPDDLIGGWAVTVTDKPPSAGYPQVADFLSEQAARHIVELHNAALRE